MQRFMTELLSPSQIGPASTRMSAAKTRSWIGGHSSLAQPCSVMSGQTPVATSWSIEPEALGRDAVALHQRAARVDQRLRVRDLRRALQRAVDEERPQALEVPVGLRSSRLVWPAAQALHASDAVDLPARPVADEQRRRAAETATGSGLAKPVSERGRRARP